MTTDYIVSYSTEVLSSSASEDTQQVTSIGLGGISISFGSSTDSAKKEAAILLADFVKDYAKQLQKFRKFKWR